MLLEFDNEGHLKQRVIKNEFLDETKSDLDKSETRKIARLFIQSTEEIFPGHGGISVPIGRQMIK